jgi:hypothetical protein
VKSLLFALLSLSSLLVAQSPTIPAKQTLILTHVTVIDATGSLAKPDMRIVIRDHRIAAIGPTSAAVLPKDAEIVDATGSSSFPASGICMFTRGERTSFFLFTSLTA